MPVLSTFIKVLFPNHSAINVVWNVGNSAIYMKSDKNPYEYGDLAKATEIVDNLTSKTGTPTYLLNTKRPNVLIIILESFGSYLIGPLGGDPAVTPNLNRYIREGICSRTYMLPEAEQTKQSGYSKWLPGTTNNLNNKRPEKVSVVTKHYKPAS